MTSVTNSTQLNFGIGGRGDRYNWSFLEKNLKLPRKPSKSKAEAIAMAELEGVQAVRLSETLGIYEEYPEAVGQAIQNFI